MCVLSKPILVVTDISLFFFFFIILNKPKKLWNKVDTKNKFKKRKPFQFSNKNFSIGDSSSYNIIILTGIIRDYGVYISQFFILFLFLA